MATGGRREEEREEGGGWEEVEGGGGAVAPEASSFFFSFSARVAWGGVGGALAVIGVECSMLRMFVRDWF